MIEIAIMILMIIGLVFGMNHIARDLWRGFKNFKELREDQAAGGKKVPRWLWAVVIFYALVMMIAWVALPVLVFVIFF